ncbi:hypothetical protein LguiA_017120 [Lonicera macranthoides]
MSVDFRFLLFPKEEGNRNGKGIGRATSATITCGHLSSQLDLDWSLGLTLQLDLDCEVWASSLKGFACWTFWTQPKPIIWPPLSSSASASQHQLPAHRRLLSLLEVRRS